MFVSTILRPHGVLKAIVGIKEYTTGNLPEAIQQRKYFSKPSSVRSVRLVELVGTIDMCRPSGAEEIGMRFLTIFTPTELRDVN